MSKYIKNNWKTILFYSFFALVGLFFLMQDRRTIEGQPGQQNNLDGRIVSINNSIEVHPTGEEYLFQEIEIEVESEGGTEIISTVNDTVSASTPLEYQVGDEVMVVETESIDGEVVYYIADYIRINGLLYLFIGFVIVAIIIGGKWGATSLIGMGFSFLVIFKFLIPLILDGYNAVIVAILSAVLIIPFTFGLSHGLKPKTVIAGIGTILTLIFTGLLAALSINMLHFTGFGSEEAVFLRLQIQNLNMTGLLLAGMIIATLGILDDITISQASIVSELKSANKELDVMELFKRSMNVGRDHISSLINTLVLVYAGASLPLMILFVNSTYTFREAINIELVAEEIVRTLVGSMGLILAVPITTLIAAYYYHKRG